MCRSPCSATTFPVCGMTAVPYSPHPHDQQAMHDEQPSQLHMHGVSPTGDDKPLTSFLWTALVPPYWSQRPS